MSSLATKRKLLKMGDSKDWPEAMQLTREKLITEREELEEKLDQVKAEINALWDKAKGDN